MDKEKELVIFSVYKFSYIEKIYQRNLFDISENIIENIITEELNDKKNLDYNNDRRAVIEKLVSDPSGFLGLYSLITDPESLFSNARAVDGLDRISKDDANSTFDYSTFFILIILQGLCWLKIRVFLVLGPCLTSFLIIKALY